MNFRPRFSVRTLAVLVTIYGVYLAFLISSRPTTGGLRIAPIEKLPIIIEALLLYFVVAGGFLHARAAWLIEPAASWRLGLAQLSLSVGALFLFAFPVLLRCLVVLFDGLQHVG